MEWRKDFFEVDLNRVDSPDIGNNWQGSKGYSRQEIEGWARKLGEVQTLSHDRGLGYDDFSRMRSSTNPDERALGDTHNYFYDHGGNSHIKLSWTGDRYTVDNGIHRVHAAKQVGLRTMPAEISAEEQHLSRCQAEGFRTPLLAPADRQRDYNSASPASATRDVGSSRTGPDRPLWERGASVQPSRKDRLDR
jgi:hypothetical protein